MEWPKKEYLIFDGITENIQLKTYLLRTFQFYAKFCLKNKSIKDEQIGEIRPKKPTTK